MEENEYDFIFKVVVIGDKNVGKSSLIQRYVQNRFDGKVPTTIGVEFHVKDIQCDDSKIKLQLWDTAGEEKYQAVTSVFYRKADAAVVVFDLKRANTFDHVKDWVENIYKHCDSNTHIILVGNKCDLEPDVDFDKISDFSDLYMIPYVETSAKNSTNVEVMFSRLVEAMVEKHKQLLSLPSMDSGPGSLFLFADAQPQRSWYCC